MDQTRNKCGKTNKLMFGEREKLIFRAGEFFYSVRRLRTFTFFTFCEFRDSWTFASRSTKWNYETGRPSAMNVSVIKNLETAQVLSLQFCPVVTHGIAATISLRPTRPLPH